MSRSTRKHPFHGIAGDSDKKDKRIANKRLRVGNKLRIKGKHQLKLLREVSNVWDMSKDGKVRFDPKKYPKMMRK